MTEKGTVKNEGFKFCGICGKQYIGTHQCKYKVNKRTQTRTVNSNPLGRHTFNTVFMALTSVILWFFCGMNFTSTVIALIFFGCFLYYRAFQQIKSNGFNNKNLKLDLAVKDEKELQAQIEFPEEPTYTDSTDSYLIEFDLDKE